MTTPPTPAGWYPDPDGSGRQRYWDGSAWTEDQSPGAHAAPEQSEPPGSDQPTAVVQTGSGGAHRKPEPDVEPAPAPTASDANRRQLIIRFGAACAALLAVLVVVLIYAFLIHKDDTIQVGASGDTTTSTSASPTSSATTTQAESETPTAAPG